MSARRLPPSRPPGRAVSPGAMPTAFVFALVATGLAAPSLAARQQQPPSPACSAPEARQFDFWLGEWSVRQEILGADGGWLELGARSRVSRALAGCALVERWQGTVLFFWEGMTEPEAIDGLSVRAWDPAGGAWAIHWMDTRSPRFSDPYVGGFEDGTGTFLRATVGPGGAPGLARIRFYDIGEDALSWDLAVSADDGSSWTTVWRMAFTRVGDAPPPAG